MLKTFDTDASAGLRSEGVSAPIYSSGDLVLANQLQMRSGLFERLFREQSLRWFAVLAAIELFLLLLAPWLAAQVRFHGDPEGLDAALALLPARSLVFAAVVWISMIALGMYQRHGREVHGVVIGTLTRLVLAMAGGGLALMALYFMMPPVEVGRGVFVLSLGFAFVLLVASRLLFSSLTHGRRLRRRALFLEPGRKADSLLVDDHLADNPRSARIVGYVSTQPPGSRAAGFDSTHRIPLNAPLVSLAFNHRIDDIVVASDDLRGGLSMDELMACRLAGINVLRLDTFYEREMGRVLLEGLRPSWFVFTGKFDRSVLRRFNKRVFDLVSATLILALAWPLMLLVALAIRLEDRGPALYWQTRTGEGGREFVLVKFRSMRDDAEGDGVARWASADDDRVTRVGRIIRKLRLDELPQLYNVLRGDMSMVGPRPERPQIVSELKQQIPYYELRHSVRPGVTGWAQLRYPYGSSVADAVEKLRYDLYYVKKQSLLFDLQILLQTVEVVLFRRGSR
ncbi:MAG: TIGR03013 family XrtA/PEP-CTERM system glycosyltransferase [Wenzhouxiangella sp.]